MKKNQLFFACLISLMGFYTACSNVKFDKKADLSQYGTQCQQVSDSLVQCSGSETIAGGKVDVLIVNDNSASMSFEQSRLAQRFNNFLSLLDGKFMDYRIGLITTDISDSSNTARSINQNGGLQDGRLISFSNGKKYLTSSDGTLQDKTSLFNQIINRPETLQCEKFITNWISSGKSIYDSSYQSQYIQNCPSSDERGIYAANLTLQNNPENFIRPEADLAIIFLSDEDVRSQLYSPYAYNMGFDLTSQDTAQSLINQITQKYPSKSFGIHAIVTKDPSCLAIQKQQISGVVNGSYGLEYNKAVEAAKSAMLARGVTQDVVSRMVVGDICSSDYTSQLQQIFSHIQGQIKDSINLGCDKPTQVNVGLSTTDSSITWSVEGNVLKFSKKLPAGTTVNYNYSCEF